MIRPHRNAYVTVSRLKSICEKVKEDVMRFQGTWNDRYNTYLLALSLYRQALRQLQDMLDKQVKGSHLYKHLRRQMKAIAKLYSAQKQMADRFYKSHIMLTKPKPA